MNSFIRQFAFCITVCLLAIDIIYADENMLWRKAVGNDANAYIKQLHGEYGSVNPIKTHSGVDIGGVCGKDVFPILPGIVKLKDERPGTGKSILIDHEDGWYSFYAHLQDFESGLVEGVTRRNTNQKIGVVGSTGPVACHLHLEIRKFSSFFHPGYGGCTDNNIYHLDDVRNLACFQAEYRDPISPSIGQFGDSLPSGWNDSPEKPGWVVSPHAFSAALMDAYVLTNKVGPEYLGVPYNNGGGEHVHCWSAPGKNRDCLNGVWIQDLREPRKSVQLEPNGHSSLILNVSLNKAFLLQQGFWGYYSNHDGFQNLGAPKSEEAGQSIVFYLEGEQISAEVTIQYFQKGSLFFNWDEDHTYPYDDGITVLDINNNVISANQSWAISSGSPSPAFLSTESASQSSTEGQVGEIDIFQNGNLLCTTPCSNLGFVDGWRYTITAPEVAITDIDIVPGSANAESGATSPEPPSVGEQPVLHDENNFSYTALNTGGTVVLQAKPAHKLYWNTFFGTTNSDEGDGIAVDHEGNSYVVGYSQESWGAPVRAFSVAPDVFVAKFSPSGEYLWHTYLGGSQSDLSSSIVVADNQVIVGGYSNSSWGSPLNAHAGDHELFLARLDESGNLLWNTFAGAPSENDYFHALAVGQDGHLLVTGRAYGTWGSPISDYSDNSDIVVAKFSPNGALVWNTFLGSDEYDQGLGIAEDTDGSVLVTGYSRASWGSPLNSYQGTRAVLVLKLNSNGSLVWNTFFGTNDARGNAIVVDGNSEIYITGISRESWGSPLDPHSGNRDILAAKLDGSGQLQWHTFFGGKEEDYGFAIKRDVESGIFIVARSETTWGAPRTSHSGSEDITLMRLDADGRLRWHYFFGSSVGDSGNSLAIDSKGRYYIVGSSADTWGQPVNSHSGSWDSVVMKFGRIPKEYVHGSGFESDN